MLTMYAGYIPHILACEICEYLPISTQYDICSDTRRSARNLASKKIAKFIRRCMHSFRIDINYRLLLTDDMSLFSIRKSTLVNLIVTEMSDDLFIDFVLTPVMTELSRLSSLACFSVNEVINKIIYDDDINDLVRTYMYIYMFDISKALKFVECVRTISNIVRVNARHCDDDTVNYISLCAFREILMLNIADIQILCINRITHWNMIDIGNLFHRYFGCILIDNV